MIKILRLSLSSLKERRLRTVPTIFMVAIGSSLITGLNGMSTGVSKHFTEQFSQLGMNVLLVVPGGLREARMVRITDETASILSTVQHVEAIIPFIRGPVRIKSLGLSTDVSLMGVERDKLPLIYPKLKLKEGELGSSSNPTIILGHDVAYPPGESTPFASLGQVVSVEYTIHIGPRVFTGRQTFIVEGILEEVGVGGPLSADEMVFIPLSVANTFFHRGGRYSGLYVITANEDTVNVVANEIRKILGEGVRVISPRSIIETIQNVMSSLQLYLGAIAGVSLIVAAVGIFAALYTSVLERTREIGILKAIGFRNSHVMILFLGEALFIGLMGGIIGNSVGIVLAYMLPSFVPIGPPRPRPPALQNQPQLSIDPAFTPEMLLMVLTFSIILSIFAGVYPAWRASRLDPVVALRKE